MNTLQKSLIFASILVVGGVAGVVVQDQRQPMNYCDVQPCPVCDPSGSDPTVPPCPTDSGWLCCDDALTVCGPGSGDGSCPGMDLWCDYYETSADGYSTCFDVHGQG